MIVVLTALLYWNARSLDRHDTAYKLARILLKNEQRTHFILEKSPIGFIAANENGMITDWNQQATETFGWTRTEAVERKFTDVIEFRSENIHKTGAKGRLPDSKEGAEEFTEARELTGFHKSGHSFPVEAAIFPIHLDDRWSLYAFVEDISERKLKEHRVLKLAGELARSNAELQEFAKVASHDLQEPLRVIQGFADLLLRRYRGRLDSKSDEFLLQIVDGADRMSQLIEAVLAHSRVQNVNRPQGISDCNVVVVEAIRNLELTIVETGAQIACAPLPQVAANSSEMLQLFQNLIGNAIKYRSCVPPKIDITVDGNEQHWLFAIKDNGIGIDAQYHSQIFDMFKRLHGRTEYAGTGIGLAICKKIVESYNGVIWVESEMGHGSTFFFTLPKFPPCDTYDRGAQESC